jgi:hypothetical protein
MSKHSMCMESGYLKRVGKCLGADVGHVVAAQGHVRQRQRILDERGQHEAAGVAHICVIQQQPHQVEAHTLWPRS